MKESLYNERREYLHTSLNEKDVYENPFDQFSEWLNVAIKKKVDDPTAFVLSTVDKDMFPSSRIVLLKEVTKEGFTFFTNYKSKKAEDISQNNKVSLNFYWSELDRQIRIQGEVVKISDELSDRYFKERPRGSQIAACASPQSEKLDSRNQLDDLAENVKNQFVEGNILRPEFWGGYCVKPLFFEFWQGRENRLHDRICYRLEEGEWGVFRIAP